MTIIKYILITFIFLSLFSCKNEVGQTPKATDGIIPVIDIEKAMGSLSNKKMNFSEFVEDITYVPLETTDESIASGKKSRLLPTIVTENYIFYGESMYGLDGRFIRKMGKVGQGPGEYVLAIGIAADEERQEFYVYDNNTRGIYVYDFENRFKRKVPTSDLGSGITSLGNGKIILFRDNSRLLKNLYEFMVIDTDSNKIIYYRHSGITENNELINLRNLKWRIKGKTYYYEGSTDTIFNLNNQGEIDAPRYTVNMGKYKYKYPGEENMVRITQIEESCQFMFFALRQNLILFYGVYNKQTGETNINKYDNFFNNDIDGSFPWLLKIISDGNEGFNDVMPFVAKERIEMLSNQNSGYDKMKNQKLREFLNKIDDEDDPIFYFFKLK